MLELVITGWRRKVSVDRSVAVLLTACVGGLIAMQAPINSLVGKKIGSFQAALFSFAVGTVALACVVAFTRSGFGQFALLRELPWYGFLGGVFGACYVTTVLITVRSLGVGPVVAATVAGQLTLAVVIDHFGLLGVHQQPITVARFLGIAALALGVWLVIR